MSTFFKYVWKCGFTYPIDDLFDCVQADDSGAFLVSSCVPGFALCTRQTIQLLYQNHAQENSCAPITHPYFVQLLTVIN